MAAPPFEAGAVKERLALALPAVATSPEGAPGTVAEGALTLELPSEPPQAERAAAAAIAVAICRSVVFIDVPEEELRCRKTFPSPARNPRLPNPSEN